MTQMRLSELAALLGLPREGDDDPVLTGAAGVEHAGPGEIAFADNPRFERMLAATRASAVIVRPGAPCHIPCLRAEAPLVAFARVLERFAPPRERLFPPGVHPTAVIHATARLGADVAIGPYCVVGAGASIGAGSALGAHVVIGPDVQVGPRCLLYPHVTVRERCRLGAEVILHPGAVIGSDGFGYISAEVGRVKIPQIGTVVLEDRVEVGANACVDRAQTDETRIGAGTKIDNLVQIGHNCRIGRDCALSAQTGISGSCHLGDQVVTAGQVGVRDHVEIGDNVSIGGKSGVEKSVPAGQAVFGYPALEAKRAFQLVALVRSLPRLFARVKRLETAVGVQRLPEDPR